MFTVHCWITDECQFLGEWFTEKKAKKSTGKRESTKAGCSKKPRKTRKPRVAQAATRVGGGSKVCIYCYIFQMSSLRVLGWEYNQLDWYSKTLSLNDVSRTFHDVFHHVFKMSSDEFTVAGSLLSAVWCALSHNCAVFGLLALEQLSHEDRMIKKSDNDNFCSKLLFF